MSSTLTSKALLISQTKYARHPETQVILEKASQIIKDLGLKIDELYDGYSTMSVYLYPRANIDHVVDATVFFNILYYFDEIFGEDTRKKGYIPTVQELLRIWETGNADFINSNDSLLPTLVQGINKLKEIILKKGLENSRIVLTLMSHLKDTFHSQDYKNLDEFIKTRLEFSGMYLTTDLLELMYDFHLSKDTLLKVPLLEEARTLCATIGALSNDLFSYPKEEKSSINLINVIVKFNPDLAKEDAINKAIDLTNEKYKAFLNSIDECLKLRSTLEENEAKVVIEYIKGLEDIVSASYHWEHDTQRYRHPLHFFQDMK